MELVLTGRMPEEIIAAADLVSEIKAVKHPIKSGLKAGGELSLRGGPE